MKYIQPQVFLNAFTCPHCGAISKQDWWMKRLSGDTVNDNRDIHPLRVSICHNCKNSSIWFEEVMYYPDKSNAPIPNTDMPENVLRLYQEAALICNKSPRGAAALLRLSVQVLCKELGEKGDNINTDIGNLVKKGLPPIVQQSLDIVRVTGNDAVHPGQIDTDDPKTVDQLFELINIIVEYMIALPKRVKGIYTSLPDEKIKGIQDRDKK